MILISSLIGFMGVTCYKLICKVRKFIGRSTFVSFIEDCILSVVFAACAYYLMFRTCGGIVRGYNYIFFFGGMIIAAKFWRLFRWQ